MKPKPHLERTGKARSGFTPLGSLNGFVAGVMMAVLSVALTHNGRVDGRVDLFHEGERVAHLDTLAAGGLPFRDVYVPHGLGEDVLKPLAARWLFGDNLAAQRRLGQNSFIYRGLLPPLGVFALIFAVAMISRSAPAAAIAFGLSTLGLLEVTERQVLGMAAIACMGAFLHFRRSRWLFASGALAALASIYSLEVGIYAVAAGFAWLVCDAWMLRGRGNSSWLTLAARRCSWLSGGFAAGIAPLLAWSAWHGIAGDLLANVDVQLFLRHELFPMSYPGLHWSPDSTPLANLLAAGSVLLLYYVMPLLYLCAMGIALVARGDESLRSMLILSASVGLVFYSSVWARPDVWHVAFATAGFFLFAAVAVVVVLAASMPPAIRVASLVSIGAVAAAALWTGELGVFGASRLRHEAHVLPAKLHTSGQPSRASTIARLAGIRLPSDQADYLEAIVGHLQANTSPSETFLDLSNQAALYYLAERRPPTRFATRAYVGTPELRAQLLRDVERRGLPRYVVVDPRRSLPRDALGRLITRYYRTERRIHGVELLRRTE